MDADAIMAKQLRQMEKEKKEKEFKLKTQEKKVHVLASCHGHAVCYWPAAMVSVPLASWLPVMSVASSRNATVARYR